MMPVLDTLLLVALTGPAVMAATELTAKSELFRPLRNGMLRLGVWGTIPRPDNEDNPFAPVAYWAARFTSDAFLCPFCSSCWHALWIVALTAYLSGNGSQSALAALLPTIAIAKVLHDTFTRQRVRKSQDLEPTSISGHLRKL